jgi:hypothetical protein
MDTQTDIQQQMEACRELAPETLLHYLNQPWKALEYVLRNRNFENKRLLGRIGVLKSLAKKQQALLAECRMYIASEWGEHSETVSRIDEMNEKAEYLLGPEPR